MSARKDSSSQGEPCSTDKCCRSFCALLGKKKKKEAFTCSLSARRRVPLEIRRVLVFDVVPDSSSASLSTAQTLNSKP